MSLFTAAIVMSLALWTDGRPAIIQTILVGYPVGITLAPLLAYPFVSQDGDCEEDNNTSTTAQYDDCSNIETAYLITGCADIAIGVVFVVFHWIRMPTQQDRASKRSKLGWKASLSPSTWSPGSPGYGVLITTFLTLYFCLQVGSIVATSKYYAQFAVDTNITSEQDATLLGFTMGLSGTVSRLLTIPILNYVSVVTLIITYIYLGGTMMLCLSIWGVNSPTEFWAFCCMFSFFSGPLWPLGYNWADEFIFLYGMVVGLVDVGKNIFDALITWVAGYMYTYVSRESIFYMSTAFALLFCVYIVVVNLVAQQRAKPGRKKSRLMEVFSISVPGWSESWSLDKS